MFSSQPLAGESWKLDVVSNHELYQEHGVSVSSGYELQLILKPIILSM